jgi:hypothetical protein
LLIVQTFKVLKVFVIQFVPMFVDRLVSYSRCKRKIMLFRGWASLLGQKKSPGGKLTALACHPTNRVNKAEELTYISINYDLHIGVIS